MTNSGGLRNVERENKQINVETEPGNDGFNPEQLVFPAPPPRADPAR